MNKVFHHLGRCVFFCIALSLLFYSCNQRPNNVLDEQKMTQIMVDMHKLDGILLQKSLIYSTADTTKYSYYKFIFKKYQLSKADFDSSLAWYTRNPEKFERIYTTIVKQMDLYKQEVNSGVFHPFDTTLMKLSHVNLWKHKKCITLNGRVGKMQSCFEINDSTLIPNDVYILQFKQRGTCSDSSVISGASIGIRYADGSVDSVSTTTRQDGKTRKYQFRITAQRQVKLKSISCKLLYTNDGKATFKCTTDSISLVRMYDGLKTDSVKQKLQHHDGIFQRFFGKKQ